MAGPSSVYSASHFPSLASPATTAAAAAALRLPSFSCLAQNPCSTQPRYDKDLDRLQSHKQPPSVSSSAHVLPRYDRMDNYNYPNPGPGYRGMPGAHPPPNYSSFPPKSSQPMAYNSQQAISHFSKSTNTAAMFASRDPSPAPYPSSPCQNSNASYTSETSIDTQEEPPQQQKRGYRRRLPPSQCTACNATETPEWRRGPSGSRSLCNACGLQYQKLFPGGVTSEADVGHQLSVLMDVRRGRRTGRSVSANNLSQVTTADTTKSIKHEPKMDTLYSMTSAAHPLSHSSQTRSSTYAFGAGYNASLYESSANPSNLFSGGFPDAKNHMITQHQQKSAFPSVVPAASNRSSASLYGTATSRDPFTTSHGPFMGFPAPIPHSKSYNDMSVHNGAPVYGNNFGSGGGY